ncbi:hypothetical protein CVT24_002111 [Panaeolus cyanescens]|uniref:Uncharacterized protein n=1 Tax=Panaeolus cyanescens TaxID=181874 RepID=A0A409YI37_9AGAR|nr:hypothetical protein CVT24_002111 [Panaeolus cyanescens]
MNNADPEPSTYQRKLYGRLHRRFRKVNHAIKSSSEGVDGQRQPRKAAAQSHPVPYLSISNHPPDDEELRLIRNAVKTAESQLKLRREEFSSLQNMLPAAAPNELRPPSEIAQLEEHISRLVSITSPLRRLPPELLRVIFAFGMFPRPSMPELHYPDYAFAWPWTVSHVCKRWRDVTLSMPSLWCFLPPFDIMGVEGSRRKLYRYRNLLKLMIKRSQDRGLHIAVTGYTTDVLKRNNCIYDLYVQHAEKWESAAFHISPAQLYRFKNIQGRIPNLRSLSIWLSPSAVPVKLGHDIFSIAPNLVEVHVYAPNFYLQFPKSHIQLLAFQSSGFTTHVTPTITSNFAYLHTLILREQDIRGLNDLVAPSLEECYLGGAHRGILRAILMLFQRATESSLVDHPLKRLAISEEVNGCIDSEPATFISILKLVPGLWSLDCPVPPVEILSMLAQTDSVNSLVPSLRCLQLTAQCTMTSPVACGINAVITSRCEMDTDSHSASPFITQVQYFVIKAGSLSSTRVDRLTSCQLMLEQAWKRLPTTTPFDSILDHLSILKTLKELVSGALPGDTLNCWDAVSDNSHSNLHISSSQSAALCAHLAKCREAHIDPQSIAVWTLLFRIADLT